MRSAPRTSRVGSPVASSSGSYSSLHLSASWERAHLGRFSGGRDARAPKGGLIQLKTAVGTEPRFRLRVSYRVLKRRFDLDDEYLEDLRAELIQAQRLAVDEDGAVLNQTTRHSYTSSLAVVPVAVRPERSAAKSKASKPARTALFDFAADAATLRANGCGFAQKVRLCANLLWFDLALRACQTLPIARNSRAARQ
jgi:hypothetical protein